MKIAMVGLGKMGANMSQRLIEHGHEVVAFDLNAEARARGRRIRGPAGRHPGGAGGRPRAAPGSPGSWCRPASPPTTPSPRWPDCSSPGDVVIDGGNSNYKETAPLVGQLAAEGIALVDAGTSGGIWGLKEGYCLMVGGTDEAVAVCEPAFLALAPEGGYAHVGPPGAGHFVKMVHNGIEYGLMQAYAEGFEIMSEAPEFDLDLHEIASIWRYGSVVRSLAARTGRAGPASRVRVRPDRRGGRRLRRGPVDGRGGHRPGGVGPGHLVGPVRPVRLAEEGRLRAPPGVGPAQPVRRPRVHHGRRHDRR